MKIARQVAWNTIIQFLSKIISIIFGLFAIALMTRYLGRTAFGEYTTINTFISFFAVAADLGLTLITVQMISRPNIDQQKTLADLFSLRFFSALLLLLLAPLTVLFFPYPAAIKLGVLITVSSYFFVALNQIMVGLFQKELKLDRVALAEIISRLALLGGVIIAIRQNWGLFGILWVSAAASGVSFAIHFVLARKIVPLKLNLDWKSWLNILKKSWPIGLTIVFNLIYLRADTLLLSIFKTQAEVGIYGAAYKIIDVLITLPFIFAGIVLPLMTAAWLQKQEKQFQNILQRSFDLMSIIALPMIFGTFFLAEDIMSLVAGQEFANGAPVLKLLMIAASTIYVGTVFSHAVIALDLQKKIIKAYAFTAATALFGYLVFIPRFSYFGAAAITIYSEGLITLAAAFLVWRHSHFLPSLRIANKSLLASLAMSAALLFLADWPLIITLPLGALSYAAALFAFGGLNRRDIWEIMSKS
jgi:O-antigen/teichoic acid export membrane protein